MNKFIIKRNADDSFVQEVGINLHRFNREKCPYIREHSTLEDNDSVACNFGIYDGEKLIAGATGHLRFEWYYLELLWADGSYRGEGLGTQLIREIEAFAKEHHALGVRLETWSFQAKGFYEKMGYTVYATFEDCPPGTVDYFLRKRF